MAESSASVKQLKAPKAPSAKIPTTTQGELAADLARLKDKYGAELFQLFQENSQDGLGQKADATTYPVKLVSPDSYDDVARLKATAPSEMGTKMLTTDDLEYLRRKEKQIQGADYKAWLASLYNYNDPAQRPLLLKVYPELMEEQMSTLQQQAELSLHLAKIRLMGGPQSPEDAKLMYAIASGEVKVPAGPLWDPASISNQAPDGNSIMRGLFSTHKPVSAAKEPLSMPYQVYSRMQGAQESAPPSASTFAQMGYKA